MSKFIYLTAIPEALIASMLPPREFGEYLSTGTKKRNRAQALFFEIDLSQVKNLIDMEILNKRCVAKPDGSPKRSVYLSVYKVLEMIPLPALKNLYLTTENGHILELEKTPYNQAPKHMDRNYLFQELCPVSPLIASNLNPTAYLKRLTDGSSPIALPKLFFVELKLGDMATNQKMGSVDYLPYEEVEHLRDCLEILNSEDGKHMKTVKRVFSGNLLYRSIETGFYIGSNDEIIYYRCPSLTELENINYEFFRSI
ncbi:MAG: hypothetical protein WAO52_12800 [Prolixibacteraceae bacterium]